MRATLVTALVLMSASAPISAQDGAAPVPDSGGARPADVPFGIGEHLSFRVKFGPLEVGDAEMGVVGVDTLDGHPAYHVRFAIKGGTFFYKLEDVQESWFDVYSLVSRRFIQDIHEGDYIRYRLYEFDLERLIYTLNDEETDSIPPEALDDASFVYFIRTLPLEVGNSYEWNRYFKYDRNPVILKVLRREKVKVPAGEFNTIVVQPIIKAGGIYGEGGESEIFVTDDERRIPVQLRSKFKLGSLTLDLIEYVPGQLLTADMLGLQ